jgi:hypothetical protein
MYRWANVAAVAKKDGTTKMAVLRGSQRSPEHHRFVSPVADVAEGDDKIKVAHRMRHRRMTKVALRNQHDRVVSTASEAPRRNSRMR